MLSSASAAGDAALSGGAARLGGAGGHGAELAERQNIRHSGWRLSGNDEG
jgi:hypothetical protein